MSTTLSGNVAPAATFPARTVVAAVFTVVMLVAELTIAPFGGSGSMLAACAAIAVFGLPHGSFDVHLLRRNAANGVGLVLACYLACAAAMAALWWAWPVAALVVFLAVAVVHFAEDWAETGSALIANGIALALIAAPALFHRAELEAIFVALTGSPDARLAGTALLLVAPVALAVAAAGVVVLARDGRTGTAVAAVSSLAAMLVLPPAVGFALFFCLFHSPRHFGEALRALAWPRARQWAPVAVPVTLAAAGIAVALYRLGPPVEPGLRAVAAMFMALSILAVPHMAVPHLLAAARRRIGPRLSLRLR